MARRIPGILIVISLLCAMYFVFVYTKNIAASEKDGPWDKLEQKHSGTSHKNLFKTEKFEDGPSVTKACLECHPNAAKELMKTAHWQWLGNEEVIPGTDKPTRIGKKNLINNFCISVEGNWPKCTVCHAGYGWKDADFDFNKQENVDCLVCHDQSGLYSKGLSGIPIEGTDLLASAESVGLPKRGNCGWCHFNGGGGNGVKHGDLDQTLTNPTKRLDIHMGKYDLHCIDCHKTEKHLVSGRMISVSATNIIDINCTDCHSGTPHHTERLNGHTSAVACQTCHVPNTAKKDPTKMAWDWSTAGQDIDIDDPHQYLKIKGSFIYEKNIIPEYKWFNGTATRYLKGDKIDPETVTHINYPIGSINDLNSKIWPFKVHRAKQPYDVEYSYLLIPKTVGKGGYWTEFDWEKAGRLGALESGLPYSGQMGFAETDMYWIQSHMVASEERALQCVDCHGEKGRMDWRALGYNGDPAFIGGRKHGRLITKVGEESK